VSSAKQAQSIAASSGVEQLIAKLRDQGVKAGRTEADAIIEQATTQAETLLEEAKQKASRIVDEARTEAERLETAGQEALRIATRDTILRFQQELMDYFNERVRRIVSEQLADPEILGRLIVEVAGKAARTAGVDESNEIEMLLPAEIVTVEDLKRNPGELQGKLTELVKGIAQVTWREGVTFKALDPDSKGIRVHVTDKDLDIDLTAKSVADILLEHMQPRFRALMQGIIQ
jgi:V/A-type H+-transporting ATPase subunit E